MSPSELDVWILRDPRESTRKCSLTPLRGFPGVRFLTFQPGLALECGGRLLLHPDGDEFGPADSGSPLLLVDCCWRRLETLLKTVRGEPVRRRLPALETAYPRRSRSFPDPERGLASIEALYGALALLGQPRPELLQGYRWSAEFLALNPSLPR